MPKLLTALAAATLLIAGSGLIWKAEAAPMTNVGSPAPVTKSYTPIEKVGWRRRCFRRGYCGPYYGYGYPYYGYAYRPYRPYGYYGYGWRPGIYVGPGWGWGY